MIKEVAVEVKAGGCVDQLATELDSSPLCERIVQFFSGHTDVVDTWEGIADWWVQDDRRLTRDALDRLVGLGVLVRRVRGGRELFSYTPDRSLRAWIEQRYTPRSDQAA
jgi:hypothetical protein